jgi:hypothetical protein
MEARAHPTWTGGCHCGAVRFEVTGPIEALEVCNCSLCTRNAYVHWTVAPDRFRLLTPDAPLTTYQFGTHTSKNHFCPTCGISPFRVARSDPDRIDVNLRCVDGIDADAFPVEAFDGRNWEEAYRARRGVSAGPL